LARPIIVAAYPRRVVVPGSAQAESAREANINATAKSHRESGLRSLRNERESRARRFECRPSVSNPEESMGKGSKFCVVAFLEFRATEKVEKPRVQFGGLLHSRNIETRR